MKKNKKDSKGFTLIELIVTIAIIAIFSGVIVTFITTGSSSYRSTSSNSKVQMETQETFDKIEDMIINANRGIYYGYGKNEPINYDDIKENNGNNSTQDKIFAVYDSQNDNLAVQSLDDDEDTVQVTDSIDTTQMFSSGMGTLLKNNRNYQPSVGDTMSLIYWDAVNSEMRYYQYTYKSGRWIEDDGISEQGQLLASGILDFRSDITKAQSDKIVRFQLTTENGNKEIQTLHSVSLRNELEIFGEAEVEPTITVTPRPTLSRAFMRKTQGRIPRRVRC